MGQCQPFAIMRLTHESIRSGLNDIKRLLGAGKKVDIQELKSTYDEVKRVIQLHAKQEDEVFYIELEKKKSGVTSSFTADHDDENSIFEKIDQLIKDADSGNGLALVNEALNNWVDDHQNHLVNEEKELMELLPKVFTYVESVEVVRSIIGYDLAEFENFQLKWVYDRLIPGQKEMYLGMLKGCSPANKYGDFEKQVLA